MKSFLKKDKDNSELDSNTDSYSTKVTSSFVFVDMIFFYTILLATCKEAKPVGRNLQFKNAEKSHPSSDLSSIQQMLGE